MKFVIWVVLAALPAMADPAEGLWLTAPSRSGAFNHVEIAPCGERLCGTLKQAFAADGGPRASHPPGGKVLWGMIPEGGGRYINGRIWDEELEKSFQSKMLLKGERLEVSGCIGLFCVAQIWRRIQ